ncbi:hypothetical protein, partial [Pseudomonas sp. URMO17WK12:I11]|uniref:hypothetical protein n=1 Tax=Pseudomonas sp. URMO17WK12:I11 TaxID=1283291 RepID=UPI001C49BC5E
MIKRPHRKWTMLSFNTHTNATKAQSSKFKVQSVGAYSKLVSIGAGGAQSPFRPYGGSLFVLAKSKQ